MSSVIPDEGEGEGHVLDVSAEEPIAGHGRAGADWNTTHDVTDKAHLFESKFDCFLDMVNVMASDYACVRLSKRIYQLPQVAGCTKHRLSTNGNPRCLAVIELEVHGKRVILLEVDTSDADKSLSTMVLRPCNYIEWEDNLNKIMVSLVRKSLKWPSKFVKSICVSGGRVGINHPRCAGGHKGLLLPDVIVGWAGRFYGRIEEMVGS